MRFQRTLRLGACAMLLAFATAAQGQRLTGAGTTPAEATVDQLAWVTGAWAVGPLA